MKSKKSYGFLRIKFTSSLPQLYLNFTLSLPQPYLSFVFALCLVRALLIISHGRSYNSWPEWYGE